MSKKSSTKKVECDHTEDSFVLSAGDLKSLEKYITECEEMAKKALDEAAACRELINKVKSKGKKSNNEKTTKKEESVNDKKKEKLDVSTLSKANCLKELEKFGIKEKDVKSAGKTRVVADFRKTLEKALAKEKKSEVVVNEKKTKKSSKSSDDHIEKKKEKEKKTSKSSKSSDESINEKKKKEKKSSKSSDEKLDEKTKKSSKKEDKKEEKKEVTENSDNDEDVKNAADAFAKQGFCVGLHDLVYPLTGDGKNVSAVAILRDGKPSPFNNKDKKFLLENKLKYEMKTEKELKELLVPLIKISKEEEKEEDKSGITVSMTGSEEAEKTFADKSEEGKESPEDVKFDKHLNTSKDAKSSLNIARDKDVKSSLNSSKSKADESEESAAEKTSIIKKKQLKGKTPK